MGLSFEFGSIPTEDAFARIILLSGENLSRSSYGRASPDTACARAFALSIKPKEIEVVLNEIMVFLTSED